MISLLVFVGGILGALDGVVAQLCRCTREFRPVCGMDGVRYSNPCLAACAKTFIAYEGDCNEACSSCPVEWSPVCDAVDVMSAEEGRTFGSECFANCNGVTNTLAANCKHVAGCSCTGEWDPMCGLDGKTYSNWGCLECAEVGLDHTGECGCTCPEILQYVCGDDGITYDNACLARCKAVVVAYKGKCMVGGGGQQQKDVEPMVNVWVKAVPALEDCGCGDDGPMVCGKNGRTYANECIARCRGTQMASTGACGSDACSDQCSRVLNIWDPVCVTQTVTAADGSTSNSAPKTFSNPCMAECMGGATPDQWYYKGECRPRCDTYCYRDKTKPVCCGKGEEFPNPCFASCVGHYDVTTECTWGQCTGDQAINMLGACLNGSPISACIRDPCDDLSCPAEPDAVCVRSYCMSYLRYELNSALCAPIWLNQATGNLVDGCPMVPDKKCTGPNQMCLLDESSAEAEDMNLKPCCEPYYCYAGPNGPAPGQKYGDCFNPDVPFNPYGRH